MDSWFWLKKGLSNAFYCIIPHIKLIVLSIYASLETQKELMKRCCTDKTFKLVLSAWQASLWPTHVECLCFLFHWSSFLKSFYSEIWHTYSWITFLKCTCTDSVLMKIQINKWKYCIFLILGKTVIQTPI